jgi:hypothetical protein
MYARLCFETPRTVGRLLETGTQDFLNLRQNGKLGESTLINSYLAVLANLPFGESPYHCRFHQI